MKKIRIKIFSILFLSFFLMSAINANNQRFHLTAETEPTETQNISLFDADTISSSAPVVLSWWNETYQYRVRTEIKNDLPFSRDVPVNLWISFGENKSHMNSIRVVEYSEIDESWSSLPYQVWNASYNGVYVNNATITFVINDFAPGTKIYYIYYNPEPLVDTTNFNGNNFDSTMFNDKVTMEWDDKDGYNYNLSFDSNKGIYQLLDDYGKNYHNENSSAPGYINPTENLIGYWNFDDGTPEELTDTIPDGPVNGYHQVGNIYYDAGKFGQSAYFDGSGDYIAINSDEMEYGGGSSDGGFTIMAWVKPSVKSSERIIASWDRSEYWRFAISSSDRVYWSTYSGNIDDMSSTAAVTEGIWTHVAATYNPSTGDKSIYINGILDRTDTNQHSSHRNLGYSPFGSRYGFIGTGSEAESFDANRGPSSYWDGGMDELRIYNSSLSQDEIQLAMDKAVKTSSIKSGGVDEVVEGEVISIFNVEWNPLTLTGTDTMTVKDTYTFYRSLNAWKINRTFHWNYLLEPPNNQFVALNTLYNWDAYDDDLTMQDYYYFDNNLHEGHSNVDFTVENYTILHDYDNSEHRTAIGLFYTGIQQKSDLLNLTDLKWKIDVDDVGNTINFVPGNSSDLTNSGGGSPDETITLEFWEYIQNDVIADPTSAKTYYNNIYQSLITPLEITVEQEESRFFNLEVSVEDHDGFRVPNVVVSLNNLTEALVYDQFIDNISTDENGEVIFYLLPANNYTISLGYNPYTTHNEIWLGNHTFELNQTTVDNVNVKNVNYITNLTSTVLQFNSNPNPTENVTSQPIVGAEIKFYEKDGPSNTLIGSEFTDVNGNVTFRWTNYTAGNPQLNITGMFLGQQMFMNETLAPPDSDLQILFENISYHIIGVAIEPFVTNMSIHDITANNIWGNPVDFMVNYNFTLNDIIYNITDADLTYKIQYRGQTLNETKLVQAGVDGEYFIHIDYNASGIPLIAGRDYTLRVNIEKPGFTEMIETINFAIANISTSLILGSNSRNIFWTQNTSLEIHFQEEPSGNSINDGEITYHVIGYPNINGILTPIGNGNYSVNIESTVFPSIGNYVIQIIGDKPNYETQTPTFQLNIEELSTAILSEADSIDLYWLESFSFNVYINDSLSGDPINDAVVSWMLVGNPSINGDLNLNLTKGNGWYTVSINSSTFNYAGDYFIRAIGTRINYESVQIDIPLKIREIYTQINNTITEIDEIDVFKTEQKLFYFSYTYRIGGEESQFYANVEDASIAYFEWEFRGDVIETGVGLINYNIETGYYELDFQTETREIGTYIITARFQEINYVSRVAIITVNVVPRVFNYEFDEETDIDQNENQLNYIVKQDESITIRFTLTETLYNSEFNNATIIWIRNGIEEPFSPLGNGTYEFILSTDVNAFVQQQIINGKIAISATDFESVNITTQIIIQMPEIFPGLPTFYFTLIIGFVLVAIGSVVGYVSIQKARIPEFIKKCNIVEKEITKNRSIQLDELIAQTKEQYVIDTLSADWEYFGLNIKEAMGLTKHTKFQATEEDTKQQKQKMESLKRAIEEDD